MTSMKGKYKLLRYLFKGIWINSGVKVTRMRKSISNRIQYCNYSARNTMSGLHIKPKLMFLISLENVN